MTKGVLFNFQTGFDSQNRHLSPEHLQMMRVIDETMTEGAPASDMLEDEYA